MQLFLTFMIANKNNEKILWEQTNLTLEKRITLTKILTESALDSSKLKRASNNSCLHILVIESLKKVKNIKTVNIVSKISSYIKLGNNKKSKMVGKLLTFCYMYTK